MARPHPALLDLVAGRPLPQLALEGGDELVRSALEHRVAGLLWSRVTAGEVRLGRELLHHLGRADLRSRAHNLRLWRTLAEVQDQLAAIDVPVASAKGITAEARWYDRLGERPTNDLDLVLAPAAAARVDSVVQRLQPNHFMADHLGELVTTGVLQSVDLLVDGTEVDLHADLLKFEVPTRRHDRLWARCVVVEGPEGLRAIALDAESSLLHFLLHLNKDRFALLHGYADIARILAREELDWEFIDEFARGEGLEAHVYCSLWAVVDDLGLSEPPAGRPSGPRAALWRTMWPARRRLLGRLGLARSAHRQFLIPWTARGRHAEALRWSLRRRVFPPRVLLGVYYPDTAGPYLKRLVVGRSRQALKRRETVRRLS